MKVKIKAILIAALLTFSTAIAANPLQDLGIGSAYIYGIGGTSSVDTQPVSNNLASSGYTSFKNDYPLSGGVGAALLIHDNYWFAIEGVADNYFMNNSTIGGTTYASHFSTRSVLLKAGYALHVAKWLSFVPNVGIGASSSHLKIEERTSASFNDSLGDPRGRQSLNRFGLGLSAGLDMNFQFKLFQSDGYNFGVLTGLQGGYTWNPVNSDWVTGLGSDGEPSFSSGPDQVNSGFYGRLVLGGFMQF